jgi:hypothetical protein
VDRCPPHALTSWKILEKPRFAVELLRASCVISFCFRGSFRRIIIFSKDLFIFCVCSFSCDGLMGFLSGCPLVLGLWLRIDLRVLFMNRDI